MLRTRPQGGGGEWGTAAANKSTGPPRGARGCRAARTAVGDVVADDAARKRKHGPLPRTRPWEDGLGRCRRGHGRGEGREGVGAAVTEEVTGRPRGSLPPRTSLRGWPRGMSPQTRGGEGGCGSWVLRGHEKAMGNTASADKSADEAAREKGKRGPAAADETMVRLRGLRG